MERNRCDPFDHTQGHTEHRRRCECGAKIVIRLRGRRNNRGWKPRKGHDLCDRCWRAQRNRERNKKEGENDGAKI